MNLNLIKRFQHQTKFKNQNNVRFLTSNITYRLADGYYSWEQVVSTALSYPAHTDIMVSHRMVPSLPECFTTRLADNSGQLADYGTSLPDNRGIHVKVYEDHYKVHWDKKDPKKDPLGHLYHDAPHWLAMLGIAGGLTIGAVAWYVYKKSKKKMKK